MLENVAVIKHDVDANFIFLSNTLAAQCKTLVFISPRLWPQ